MSRSECKRADAARAAAPHLYGGGGRVILASAAEPHVLSLNDSLLPAGRGLASEEARGLQPWGEPLRA